MNRAFFFTGLAWPAGFDCDRAETDMENTICRDCQLAAMDREMNALYRRVTGQKTSQKKWLGRRMACGNDAICLASVYCDRMVELVSVITGTDFSLYQYAHHVIDDDFFHPRAAILVENYIKDHIGDASYEAFSACSSRHSAHQVTSNYLFGAYGCPGMFTFMESAAYIDAGQIWIAFIDYTDVPDNQPFIAVYGPRSVTLLAAPDVLNDWIKNLQSRIKEPCSVVFHDAL